MTAQQVPVDAPAAADPEATPIDPEIRLSDVERVVRDSPNIQSWHRSEMLFSVRALAEFYGDHR